MPVSTICTSPTRKRVAVCSSDGAAYTGEVPQGRQLGTQDWCVFYDDDTDVTERLSRLESTVEQIKSTSADDAELFGESFIRNAASEVLLHAIGEQPKPSSQSSRFQRLEQGSDARLAGLVTSLNNVLPVPATASSMAVIFDKIINRRNATIHRASSAELKKSVQKAVQLLQRHPSLQQKFAQEYMVLSNFSKFRAAFRF